MGRRPVEGMKIRVRSKEEKTRKGKRYAAVIVLLPIKRKAPKRLKA